MKEKGKTQKLSAHMMMRQQNRIEALTSFGIDIKNIEKIDKVMQSTTISNRKHN